MEETQIHVLFSHMNSDPFFSVYDFFPVLTPQTKVLQLGIGVLLKHRNSE